MKMKMMRKGRKRNAKGCSNGSRRSYGDDGVFSSSNNISRCGSNGRRERMNSFVFNTNRKEQFQDLLMIQIFPTFR